jgi:hypothetical protein
MRYLLYLNAPVWTPRYNLKMKRGNFGRVYPDTLGSTKVANIKIILVSK